MSEKLLGAARSVLGSRRALWSVPLAACLLSLPALFVGLQLDDYFHLANILGLFEEAGLPAHGGIFTFIDGDPERNRALKELGILPWWAQDDLRAAFWRPLSELTHRLDHWLWPGTPPVMHLQSLLWFAALVVVALALYRRLLGPSWIAGLAGLLFAIDDAHGIPIGWLANRNALLAAFFGLLALLAHDRWRRDGWKMGAVLAVAALAAGLLSGEAALGAAAYLFAYAVFIDRARAWARLASLAPYAFLIVGWRVAYDAMGYGAWGSGLYIDPGAQPLRYLGAVADRAPVLLAAQLGPLPSDLDVALPPKLHHVYWLGAALFLVLVALALSRTVRQDPVGRFLALGTVLSVLPVCATFANDRLLLFVGFGAMGLVAKFLSAFLEEAPRGASPKLAALFLAGTHLALAPLLLPFRVYTPVVLAELMQCADTLPDDPGIGDETLVLVAAPEFCGAYVPVWRSLAGKPLPRRIRTLASGIEPITVSRRDSHTLALQRADGFFSYAIENLFRSPETPWAAGAKVQLSDLTVEVASLTPEGRPEEVVFRFALPLEDPSLRWYAMRDSELAPFTLPSVGAEAVLVPSGFGQAPRN